MVPTSKRVEWTLFGLQAYVKESQIMASRDKYQLVPEFQGMNIYSDKCPVSEPYEAIIQLSTARPIPESMNTKNTLQRCGMGQCAKRLTIL